MVNFAQSMQKTKPFCNLTHASQRQRRVRSTPGQVRSGTYVPRICRRGGGGGGGATGGPQGTTPGGALWGPRVTSPQKPKTLRIWETIFSEGPILRTKRKNRQIPRTFRAGGAPGTQSVRWPSSMGQNYKSLYRMEVWVRWM